MGKSRIIFNLIYMKTHQYHIISENAPVNNIMYLISLSNGLMCVNIRNMRKNYRCALLKHIYLPVRLVEIPIRVPIVRMCVRIIWKQDILEKRTSKYKSYQHIIKDICICLDYIEICVYFTGA